MTEDRVPDCDAWMGKSFVCTEPKGHDGEHLSLGKTIQQHEAAMTEDRVPTICAACGGTDEPVVNVPLHPRCAEQPAPPLDVERLTTVLIEAEADDMLGSEYMPSRLAKYIAARLGSAPSRSEPDPPVQVDRDFTNPDGTPGRYR